MNSSCVTINHLGIWMCTDVYFLAPFDGRGRNAASKLQRDGPRPHF